MGHGQHLDVKMNDWMGGWVSGWMDGWMEFLFLQSQIIFVKWVRFSTHETQHFIAVGSTL